MLPPASAAHTCSPIHPVLNYTKHIHTRDFTPWARNTLTTQRQMSLAISSLEVNLKPSLSPEGDSLRALERRSQSLWPIGMGLCPQEHYFPQHRVISLANGGSKKGFIVHTFAWNVLEYRWIANPMESQLPCC